MWKHCLENAYDHISLRDCVVSDVELTEDTLSLCFDDGFWILPASEYNDCGETVRTDKSKLNFIDFDKEMSGGYIFKRHYIFGKRICTTRHRMDFEELISNVLKGIWEIEFSEQYHAKRCVLFFGSVTTKKNIWEFDFQLVVDCEKIEYCWNDIYPNRKW